MEPKTVGGITLVELEPGAPLPPGVPPTAIRCDVVEMPDLSPRWKPWVIGTGAVGTLGSVVVFAFFTQWAVVTFVLALVLFYYGIAPITSPVVVPSETGRYLGFEKAREEEAGSGVFGRLAAIVVGAVVAGGSIFRLFSADRSEWLQLGALGVIGCYFLYVGLTGDDGRDDDPVERTTSLKFLTLADPARPLPAADPVTTGSPRAIDAAAPSPDALPAEGSARRATGPDAD